MVRLGFLLFIVILAACAPRDPVVVVDAQVSGQVLPVFVATTRAPDPVEMFGTDRSANLHYARLDVSIPPTHEKGEVERSRGNVDPTRHFTATAATNYSGNRDFAAALRQHLAQRPAPERTVTIYVHGFNNDFADGVYRIAQIQHDIGLSNVAVHYSWPSAAHPLGYAHDRDSALFARDGLEQLIRTVKAAGAREVLLVGHSMGALLTMESIRQMAIADVRDMRRMLDGVVLISADIDVELFNQQARRIGPLPQPFVILTSSRDRALQLSARLTGQTGRLGNVTDARVVAEHEVTLINVSDFSDGIGHFPAATSPELLALLSKLTEIETSFANDPTAQVGLIPGTVIIVQNVTEIILRPAPG